MSTDSGVQVPRGCAGNGDHWPTPLLPHHQRLLEASGITPAVARARGYRSVRDEAELARLDFTRSQRLVPALLIPVWNLDGQPALHQIRPDACRMVDGKPARYEVPFRKKLLVDVPPIARESALRGDVRLFVVLGVRKADALVSRGECCISLLNSRGWKRAERFWERIPLQGRPVRVVLDSDAWADATALKFAAEFKSFLETRRAAVQVVTVPGVKGKGKLGVDDYLAAGHGVDLAQALELLNLPAPLASSGGHPRYLLELGGVFREKGSGAKAERTQLTNFPARIVAELVVTDGADEFREFEIEAIVGGKTHRLVLPAGEFARMDWPERLLGAQAIIYEGYGYRGHARVAIQATSGEVPTRRVSTHLGWGRVDGEDRFFHAGGTIGAGTGAERDAATRDSSLPKSLSGNASEQIGSLGPPATPTHAHEVRAPRALANYVLPTPPRGRDLATAVRSSLEFLDLGPDRLVFPVYAAIWRAPIGNADLTVQITGCKEVGKTELVARAMQHFGPGMDSKNLPGGWSSTANYLETLAFLAKDVVLAVDDFVPRGSRGDVDRANRDANQLLRAQANRAGRGRSSGSGALREGKPPRGLIISTGEDTPSGESLNTRFLNVNVSEGDISWGTMTISQEYGKHGIYARAMAGYIRWLASMIQNVRSYVECRVAELRAGFRESAPSRRLASLAAELGAGFEVFLDFAVKSGAITSIDAEKLCNRCDTAFVDLLKQQVRDQRHNDPADQFIELIRSALITGRCHVTSLMGEAPSQFPTAMGWRERTVRVNDAKDETDQIKSKEQEKDKEQEKLDCQKQESEDGIETEFTTVLVPQGKKIGWWQWEHLCLDGRASLAEAQRLAREIGFHLSLTVQKLGRKLCDKGYMASPDESRDRYTKRINVDGARVNVLCLLAHKVIPPPSHLADFLEDDYDGPPPEDTLLA